MCTSYDRFKLFIVDGHKARIALLEGERRSFENIRLDLARRIKMLEYALRMERCVNITNMVVSFTKVYM